MEVTITDIFVLLAVALGIFYWYGRKTVAHFRGTDVKHVEPSLPYFGSALNVFLFREHFRDFLIRNYHQFPDEKYIGLFEGPRPLIMLRDVELIKQILIKDFDCFPNHRSFVDKDSDAMFGSILFSMHGEKWKDMRAMLSPAFTSAKMRNMFIFTEACAKEVAKFYMEQFARTDKDIIEIEGRDTFTRYTNDVIANSAFGVRVNSLKDRENVFYQIASVATTMNWIQTMKCFFFVFFPIIPKLLKIQFINSDAKQFLRDLISSTMKVREHNSIVRMDMIHLLMEAKSGIFQCKTTDPYQEQQQVKHEKIKRVWADEELFAQGLVFLLGAFESTSVLISYFFYEMARNPDIQRKLQEELDHSSNVNSNHFFYGDLQNLKYLDACVLETLRMWPPTMAIDRVCTKSYVLPPPNDSSKLTYEISPGHAVWVPVYSLHHDPNYYPEPEVFNPERFSDENRSTSMKAFMPFGIGPRNCIGSRFALMICKLIVIHIVSKFDIVTTEKTQIPIKLDGGTLCLLPHGGVYVGLKKRTRQISTQ